MFWKRKMEQPNKKWSYVRPEQSGFYWYVEDGHMAVAYVRYLDKSLQYQRQTVAEVELINGAGAWPKREIETCNGMWMKLDEPT